MSDKPDPTVRHKSTPARVGKLQKNRPNLKIADWEYLYAEQIIGVYLDNLIKSASLFSQIMDGVANSAIQDGAGGIAESCCQFSHAVTTMQCHIEELRSQISGVADAFIAEIDQEDQFLYGQI